MSALEKKMSYLRARDPSLPQQILRPRKLPVDTILEDSISEEDLEEESSLEEESGMLDVYLRIKNTEEYDEHLYEVLDNTLTCCVPEDTQTGRNVKDGERQNRTYTFTNIFPASSTQVEVFDGVVKKKIIKCLNGTNSNLLTYGPSGSGKTFTIVGTQEAPGMIPQSLEYLFRSIQKLEKYPFAKPMSGNVGVKWLNKEERTTEFYAVEKLLNKSIVQHEMEKHYATYAEMQKRLSKGAVALLDELESSAMTYSVWISFAEVYNECVYDLLAPSAGKSRKKLKVYNNNGETYVKDLKHVYVNGGDEAYCILQYGLLNLNYAATSINSHSSRSHCIFTITFVQAPEIESPNYSVSRINFCDLAGSERSKKTNNSGSRLNESNNINNSLMVLGRCISSIHKAQKSSAKRMIPFRESKLTLLFHKALQGEEDISMVVAVNPNRHVFDETIHALNFSAIAKQISLEKSNQSSTMRSTTLDSMFSVADYEQKIDALQLELADARHELLEVLQQKEQQELDIRQEMVRRFQNMYDAAMERARVEKEKLLDEKEEIIEAQQEEIERLKEACADPDSSVISISSAEENTSMRDKLASLSSDSKRYNKLFEENEALKVDKELLEIKVKEQEKTISNNVKTIENYLLKIKYQEDMLHRQKQEIVQLQEENDTLDKEVISSIRYSNFILRDCENNSTHSESSEDLSTC